MHLFQHTQRRTCQHALHVSISSSLVSTLNNHSSSFSLENLQPQRKKSLLKMQSFLTISSFVLNEHVKGDENLLKSRLGVRRVAGSMQDFMDNCSTYNWDIQNLLKVDSDGAWRHSWVRIRKGKFINFLRSMPPTSCWFIYTCCWRWPSAPHLR